MLCCKALILAATGYAFLYLILHYYPETDFWFKGFVIFEFLYLVIFLAFSSTYNCFSIGVTRLRELIFSYILTTATTDFIIYFVLSLTAKMMLPPGPLFYMMLCQWGVAIVLYTGSDLLYYALNPARSAIVVCSAEKRELATLGKFANLKERFTIRELCPETVGYQEITARIQPYSAVILGNIDHELRMELSEYCFERNKRLFYIPTVQDLILHSSHETFIGDSLVYQCKNSTFTVEQLAVKRLMDIGISLLMLIATSPIMLVTAILIKLYDGGPVLFRQVRYTRNLSQFTLVKFRSMVVDAEKDGPQLTVPDDKRITPIGKFIRRTRIDELPQLFNILRGEMSLVGPRAERIENVDYYCELMPEFRYRMKVKAGLTGYAQIFGKYNTTYEDKLKMDLLYIENCSLVRDLQLLFLTLKIFFLPDSTEGFDVDKLSDLPTGTDAAAQQTRESAEEPINKSC